ncbi:RNA pyrophosphohydrolase [Labrys okinawensis]|uniref:RNA pyrophosphohydrolase n=1 Tax=Labrys okinawensis TaxID=346911 RepID=A0A2S9QHM5_9HYPH|nr:RNA pyrophosphohydrolase [Labrys okinawensis]PRH88790.1 RNA pyrophosphohydrolase [Labrys okinawensis]
MTDRSKLPYRPCAGAALFNAQGRVFVGRRKPRTGGEPGSFEWQMPQGGIDEGEDPREAAIRELYEETNVRSITFLAEAPDWYSYDLPPEAVGGGWTARYRGQTQKWFAFRFTGPDSEIDVLRPAGGKHKAEFGDWRWEDLAALPGLIVPFKRGVYAEVVAAFRHLVA